MAKRFTFYWLRPSGVFDLIPAFRITFEKVADRRVLGAEIYFLKRWCAVEIDLVKSKEVHHG